MFYNPHIIIGVSCGCSASAKPNCGKKRCLERTCTNKHGSAKESVVYGFSMNISQSDLNTLLIPLNWLNDQVNTSYAFILAVIVLCFVSDYQILF